MPDPTPKRRYPRLTCRPKAPRGEAYPFNDLVKNISRSGCLVETDAELEIGDTYELVVARPGGQPPLERRGEVVWEVRGKAGGKRKRLVHAYGIRFVDDEPEMAAALVDALLYYKFNRKI